MGGSLTRAFERAKQALAQIGVGQRIVIGILVVGLLLGAFVFSKWVTAPTYAPLFSNLASTDASAIVEELNAAGVPYELADGGATIMVDRNAVYDTRLTMSAAGLPAGEATGYALLDEQGITTSEFQQQVSYQRAMESELAATLEALDGVTTAVVHVAIPKQEVFVNEDKAPSASVLLDLEAGADLSGTQIQTVTNLVASSIEGMTPEQVTVADSTGEVLSAAGEEFGGSSVTDAQTEAEAEYEGRLGENAQEMLDRIVGPGMAVVRVRADLDFDKRESQTKTYNNDPDNPPLSESNNTETYTGQGAAVGGVLGPDAQPGATNDNETNYEKESSTVNNAVGESVETVQNAPGAVNRLTVSVVVDEEAALAADQGDIEALVANAVGLDEERGDAITVAAMPLDTTLAEAAAEDIAAAKADKKAAEMQALIRNGVIGGVLALFALIFWWTNRRRRKAAQVVNTPTAAPTSRMTPEQQAELDAIRAELAKAQSRSDGMSEVEIVRRQSVRSEITDMITSSPDEAAAMLRGWLVEEKA